MNEDDMDERKYPAVLARKTIEILSACAGMSIGCVVLSIAPPFPAFIVMLMFMGFGSGA
jgi:hypothetical protein